LIEQLRERQTESQEAQDKLKSLCEALLEQNNENAELKAIFNKASLDINSFKRSMNYRMELK
jgi:hypothetical protein